MTLLSSPTMQAALPQMQAAASAKPLLSDAEFSRLKEQVSGSYKSLESHRNARIQAIKQYVGESYGNMQQDTIRYESVVNMLDQLVEVLLQQLVSGNPQVLVLTNSVSMKAAARYFEMALNHVAKQIDLRDTLRFAILESLFSLGIVKVGVEHPDYTDRQYPFDASAYPFADAVFFDHWVHDAKATRWELCRFYGDQYKEHRDVIQNDARNDPEIVKNLDSGIALNAYDTSSPDLADNLGKSQSAYDTEDEKDLIPLWDIYLPRRRLLVTYLAEGNNERPLRVVKWTGPETGPYYICRYKLVPNQIMPKPPALDITALADLENKLWLKMGEQASRQKTVGFATLGATEDAQRIVRASDGDVINVTHPDAVSEMKFGGVQQETLTFAQVVKQRASYEGGNLDTMGGLATQADTLGQEQMLQASSSGRIRSMQQSVVALTKQVMWSIGWYLWNDPLVRVAVTDKIPGTDIELDVQWPIQQDVYGQEQDLRAGEYNDLSLDIEPFSMVDQTPGARLQLMRNVFQTDIMPAMQLLMAQGISIDMEAYLENIEAYANLPELKEIIQKVSQPMQDTTPNFAPGKPASTTRTYDRVTKPKGPDESVGELIGSMPKTPGA